MSGTLDFELECPRCHTNNMSEDRNYRANRVWYYCSSCKYKSVHEERTGKKLNYRKELSIELRQAKLHKSQEREANSDNITQGGNI